MAAVWILAVIGLVARPLDRYGTMALGLLAYTVAVVTVSFGAPRFADPVLLTLVPFAAYAVLERRSVLQSLREPGRLPVLVVSLLILAGLWVLILAEKLAGSSAPGILP